MSQIVSYRISIKVTMRFGLTVNVYINSTSLQSTGLHASVLLHCLVSLSSSFGCHISYKVKRCINSTYSERSGCTNKRKVLYVYAVKVNGKTILDHIHTFTFVCWWMECIQLLYQSFPTSIVLCCCVVSCWDAKRR